MKTLYRKKLNQLSEKLSLKLIIKILNFLVSFFWLLKITITKILLILFKIFNMNFCTGKSHDNIFKIAHYYK
jgi:hypothetical protein